MLKFLLVMAFSISAHAAFYVDKKFVKFDAVDTCQSSTITIINTGPRNLSFLPDSSCRDQVKVTSFCKGPQPVMGRCSMQVERCNSAPISCQLRINASDGYIRTIYIKE